MAVFSAYNTRIVALLSFVVALLYYQSGHHLPDPETVVQVNEGGQLVNLSLSPEEMESYLRSQQLQPIEKQDTEITAANKFSKLPVSSSPPPLPPSPRKTPGEYEPKFFLPESNAVYLPVLRPSNGSYLDTIDVSGYHKKEREFLERRLSVLRQRASVLSYECKIRPNLAEPGPLHLVWDTKHIPNVVWCPNYKVGSTSWMINFLRLAHFNDDNPALLRFSKKRRKKMKYSPKYGAKQSQVYKLFPPPKDLQERNRVFNNSLRMIVVRHPFSRLISAYRDKMQKEDPKPKEHNFRELQHQIIDKYRPKGSQETSPFPTFSEFIQYTIDSTEKLKTRKDWIKNVRCWTPFWAQCNVCASDYNLIMKLETMDVDQKFINTIADMKELKKLTSPEWRHLTGVSSDDLMKKYMSQLTRRQAWDLYQRYLLDYILFGYTLEDDLLDYTQN